MLPARLAWMDSRIDWLLGFVVFIGSFLFWLRRDGTGVVRLGVFNNGAFPEENGKILYFLLRAGLAVGENVHWNFRPIAGISMDRSFVALSIGVLNGVFEFQLVLHCLGWLVGVGVGVTQATWATYGMQRDAQEIFLLSRNFLEFPL